MTRFDESAVEEATLEWLTELGWQVLYGPDIAPDTANAERNSYDQIILEGRLQNALLQLNPNLPDAALEDALHRLARPDGATIEARNRAFHLMLVNGVNVEYRDEDGAIRGAQVRVLDVDHPGNNNWLATNQFTVAENRHRRRPDIVLFVNGLPLGIIELKNPADPNATIRTARQQLQTYKTELPTLFSMNEMLIVSDGIEARIGTVTSEWEWFKPWRTLTGEGSAPNVPELRAMLHGVAEPSHFLALIRDFIVFDDDGGGSLTKKMAGYHQFHAVRVAIGETVRAAATRRGDDDALDSADNGKPGSRLGGSTGDRRIGVVWHTQGSGKSLTMAFYAGAVIREPAMENPTIVVITDRNDLDDQLFGTFSRCQDLLRQPPVQAGSRADLRRRLSAESGGVVFTTIQKFLPPEKGDRHPVLSTRRNIVVIADEAHRSQYDFIDGFARHMRDALPSASFIGFTGTPIELNDANTRAVFGEHISIYDIRRSVEDGATVPIYYESRMAKLSMDEGERPTIDEDFEEITEREEMESKERLKTRWAQLEAIVGSKERLRLVAEDIIDHLERRCQTLEGKAMIVCMSRRICAGLYQELVRLRPDWHDERGEGGIIKVVMTGSASDPPEWQQHIRNKAQREALANRFRRADDPFRIVLVRDMWLTGFDAPSLHTMYLDKPMRGHGLMQAVARVNRVFRDKPGGLVVDYIGLAQDLKRAFATYTESGGTGEPAIDQEKAAQIMLEKYEVCSAMFHGFDWSGWAGGASEVRLGMLPGAQEHILSLDNGKARYIEAVTKLTRAYALASTRKEAEEIRDAVGFFQAVRGVLAKKPTSGEHIGEDLDGAIREIVSRAVESKGVLDIFAAAGLDKPDISILSDEFLEEVRGMPRRNLAVDILQKLLNMEILERRRKNVVQARSFAEMLERALRRYHNRSVEAAQVIEELIQLAREMRGAKARGERLGLTDDETAFYDALETNDSAVQVLGDDALRTIAQELVRTVRNNVAIDWTIRENVRAKLRVLVKRVLRRYGYPPDKQEKATRTVLEQAEVLADGWIAE